MNEKPTTPTKKARAKAVKEKLVPKRKPLDFDSFEQAIVNDWSQELTAGTDLIKSLPPEFVKEVRQDLIRLATWVNHPTSRLLFILTQGDLIEPIEQMQKWIAAYEEFKHLNLFFINETNFDDKFIEAVEKDNPKVVVAIPFEFFSAVTVKDLSKLTMPSNDVAWSNYIFLAEILPPTMTWHTIAYSKSNDSSLIQIALDYITMALIFDRTAGNERR